MEFTKIKIEHPDYPKRFYRVIAVAGDPTLLTLGVIIGRSINASFEHFFMFRSGKNSFVADQWLEESPFYDDEDYSISKSNLSDLGDKFIYTYDTGCNWSFNCTVYKRPYINNDFDDTHPDNPLFGILVDGKGWGIFEDNRYTFEEFMDGRIDPNFSFEDEDPDDGLVMPFDFPYETLAGFDAEIEDIGEGYYLQELEYFLDLFSYDQNNFSLDDQFDDYDEDEDDIDEDDFTSDDLGENILSSEMIQEAIFAKVAFDIFNDEKVNDQYRRLEKIYDMEEVYDMITTTFLECLSDGGDPDTEAFQKTYYKKLSKLK